MKQLIDLGYVTPPAGDAATAVHDCMIENRYNLARAHMDAASSTQAGENLSSLIAEDSEQTQYISICSSVCWPDSDMNSARRCSMRSTLRAPIWRGARLPS